jgi:hypothetical protein
MNELLAVVGFLIVYLVLTRFVFPKLGVPT